MEPATDRLALGSVWCVRFPTQRSWFVSAARSHFVFYDYSEPVILFLIDYLSVMVMFVLIGYLISMLLKRLPTFLFTLRGDKTLQFSPNYMAKIAAFFSIFKLLLLQFVYASARKMRDCNENISLPLGFQ